MSWRAKILCGVLHQHQRPTYFEFNTYIETWEGQCPRCNIILRWCKTGWISIDKDYSHDKLH